jgi:hypothetical protein
VPNRRVSKNIGWRARLKNSKRLIAQAVQDLEEPYDPETHWAREPVGIMLTKEEIRKYNLRDRLVRKELECVGTQSSNQGTK